MHVLCTVGTVRVLNLVLLYLSAKYCTYPLPVYFRICGHSKYVQGSTSFSSTHLRQWARKVQTGGCSSAGFFSVALVFLVCGGGDPVAASHP